jgi:phage terminase small subunit
MDGPLPIDPPAWLTGSARDVWVELLQVNGLAWLTAADQFMLHTFCILTGKIRDAAKAGEVLAASYYATQATIANKLGLDPSGRVKLSTPEPEKPQDAWAAM